MKKGLIFVLFALVSIVSYSQISWNVKAGMTMNNMTKLDDTKMKLGYTFGVGADYALNDMWSVQSGLNITAKGYKFDLTEEVNGKMITIAEGKKNPIYLELPILAAVKFNIADNMKLVVNAGPYLAFGLGGKASLDAVGDYKKQLESYDEPTSVDYKLFKKYTADSDEAEYMADVWKEGDDSNTKRSEMKRFDLGLQYGVGLEFGHYLINLSGQYGFLKTIDTYKYNEKTDKEEKLSPKNMNFAITVGYKF